MPDAFIRPDIADSPLGLRLRWALSHLWGDAPELTDPEVTKHFSVGQIPLGVRKQMIAAARAALRGSELRDVRAPGELFAVAELARDGICLRVNLRIESEPPHRIRNMMALKPVPGVTIRAATPADAATLRDIELQVPIVIGETSVVYDRGEDYFAPERLMGDAVTHVVEVDGRPVGLTAWVEHDVLVNGQRMRAAFKHRQRLLQEARGQGIRQMQDFEGLESSWRSDIMYTYAAVENANIRHIYRESEWKESVERIVIDTSHGANAHSGRRATAQDSATIVGLVNRTHGHEEMYLPYTSESLAERLGREPTMYSWANFRIGARATLGTWPASLNVIRTTPGGTTIDRRALVLDYGYENGAVDEFVGLVRAECSVLAAAGMTELAIFVPPQSACYAPLTSMAKRIEPYVLYLYVPPPSDLAERGVYVDQLYF